MYQPYNIRELEALVKQLPPITEGGAAWLRKLQNLRTGRVGPMGFSSSRWAIYGRRRPGRCQRAAGTMCAANDSPYDRVQNSLANAVRNKYPTS